MKHILSEQNDQKMYLKVHIEADATRRPKHNLPCQAESGCLHVSSSWLCLSLRCRTLISLEAPFNFDMLSMHDKVFLVKKRRLQRWRIHAFSRLISHRIARRGDLLTINGKEDIAHVNRIYHSESSVSSCLEGRYGSIVPCLTSLVVRRYIDDSPVRRRGGDENAWSICRFGSDSALVIQLALTTYGV